MKYILCFAVISFVVSCCPKINTAKKLSAITTVNNDSVENLRYIYLKGFATCKCVYAVPENSAGRVMDISPSIFADIVNFWGIDTLSHLANEEAQKIKLSKYKDYQNKKPTFIHCYEWANSPCMDTSIRKYAKASSEEWMKREGVN